MKLALSRDHHQIDAISQSGKIIMDEEWMHTQIAGAFLACIREIDGLMIMQLSVVMTSTN